LLRLGTIGAAILAMTLLTAWLTNRDISGSLGKLTHQSAIKTTFLLY
jgi:hypothetical protein